MSIQMPKVSYGKCLECQVAAEYYFSEYGSQESCINCDAAPSLIIKVSLVNA